MRASRKHLGGNRMNLSMNYHINKPLQLKWMYISPTEDKGLEYHLSPDLSLHIEGIFSGDYIFDIGHIILALEQVEANELQADEIFYKEFLPGKSKERVAKAYKDGETSCFFTTRHMEYLQNLFESKNFIASHVALYYKGRKVDDPVELPSKEFQVAMDAFEELEVKWEVDEKASRQEVEEAREQAIKKNAGKLEEKKSRNMWEKIKTKKMLRRLGMAIGSSAIAVTGLLYKKHLMEKPGIGSALVAIAIGVVSLLAESYVKQEINNYVMILRYDK